MTGRMPGGTEAAAVSADPGGSEARAAGAHGQPGAPTHLLAPLESPVHLPSPSLWPATLGLGLTLLGAGLLLHVALGVAGALLSAYAIVQWVADLRRENAGDHHQAAQAQPNRPPSAAARQLSEPLVPEPIEDATLGTGIHEKRTTHE